MNRTDIRHTFVVCAYKESPFLEECIKSLLSQTIKSDIIIETSTPNHYISEMADKYALKIHVNNGESGCANDWNYGYNIAKTGLVTIAHQDDIYYNTYTEEVLRAFNEKVLIIFTDYAEIRNGIHISNNLNLNIKRKMNHIIKKHPGSIKWRRFVLSFGDSISCPTVTFNKNILKENVFSTGFKCSVDYDTWEKLSNINGQFVYIPKILMGHRIYKESSTTIFLLNNTRQQEDYEILSRFWPRFIVNIIYKLYSFSEKSNNVK